MALSTLLILCAIVIIACLISHRLTSRMGIPYLIGFIGLGMLFGSDGVVRIQFENFKVAHVICTIALIFIMFYGGFETNLKQAKKILPSALSLSTVGVFLTALLLTGFIHIFLKLSLIESFLISAVLSSTDAASVFSILKSKQLGLKYQTSSLLEIESGSNDPFAYLLATMAIVLFKGAFQIEMILGMMFGQIVIALLTWYIFKTVIRYIFDRILFDNSAILALFIMAIAIFSYALPEQIGGNGYLAAYLVGLSLGNGPLPNKKDVIAFFEGIITICQMLTFFLLGLLSFPKLLPELFVEAIVIAVVLMFIVRPIVVYGIGYFYKMKPNQMAVISWAGLRGASSIVFAIMIVNNITLSIDIFHIVLCVVLLSITFQGSLLPLVSQKMDMIDSTENVLKTFNFYSEEVPLNLMRMKIPQSHDWVGKRIDSITFPPSTLVFQIERNHDFIVPKGDTVIFDGDIVNLIILNRQDTPTLNLYQVNVEKDSSYLGKTLEELSLKSQLIIAIEREGTMLVPNGQTVILLNDCLLIQKKLQK